MDSTAVSAEQVAHRVDDRVAGLETRMTNTQTALRQLSGDVARVQASVKQIERVVAAETPRAGAARGPAEAPRPAPPFVRRPASLSSAPSASPATEPPRPDARLSAETTAPGVPPAPIIALPSSAWPPPSQDDRLGPPSTPRSEQDLKTKLREDWETAKRDARNAGHEIKDAFRKFRDWISP